MWYPDGPLRGLDVCYFTSAMLTGAGTFAREAALLGRPAVSFFPSEVFLSVDEEMQRMGIEFKSRNPKEIAQYVREKNTYRASVSQERSKKVLDEVLQIFDNILKEIE